MTRHISITKKFQELSRPQQNKLLLEIYNYSSDLKLFLDSKLGFETDYNNLIQQMEKETIGKVYRKNTPGIPNGRVVNTILSKAYKADAPISVLLI